MGAVDEILATVRRLPLRDRLRLIEQAANEAAEDTPKPAGVPERARTLSVDELLAARLAPPPGMGPVSFGGHGSSDRRRRERQLNPSAAPLLRLMADEPDLVDQVCALAYEARRAAHLHDVDE